MKEEIKRRGCEELARTQTYNALIAIPLCMLEVAWDMVDSVCDVLSINKIRELKKVCRMLKEYHKEYRYKYESNPEISHNRFAEIKAWCTNYLESTNGDKGVTLKLETKFKERYSDINTESRILIISAFKAWIYFKATVSHTEAEERHFAFKIGLPNIGHMLPSAVYGAIPLLESIFEETPLGKEFLNELISVIKIYMKELSQRSTEPIERTEYRQKCIAYICNQGCREQALEGHRYGCYASSLCKRMMAYDARQKQIMNTNQPQ